MSGGALSLFGIGDEAPFLINADHLQTFDEYLVHPFRQVNWFRLSIGAFYLVISPILKSGVAGSVSIIGLPSHFSSEFDPGLEPRRRSTVSRDPSLVAVSLSDCLMDKYLIICLYPILIYCVTEIEYSHGIEPGFTLCAAGRFSSESSRRQVPSHSNRTAVDEFGVSQIDKGVRPSRFGR